MVRGFLRVFCLTLGLVGTSGGFAIAVSDGARGQTGDRAPVAEIYNNAIQLQALGKLDQAEALYLEMIPILVRTNRTRDLGLVHHNLGTLAVRRGDYEEAIALYDEALRLRQEVQDKSGLADTYHNLGNIAREQQDYARATRMYEKSLLLRESLDNKERLIATYNSLGSVVLEREVQEAMGKASWFFYKILGSVNLFGIGKHIADFYGRLHINKSLTEAHGYHESALAISQTLDHRTGLATSYRKLGNIAQLRSNWADAINFYKKSLAQYEALEDTEGVAGSYNNLGNVSAKRKDFFDAEIWYDKALVLYESLEDTPGQLRVYTGLAVVAFQDHNYIGAVVRFYRVLYNALYNLIFE